MDLREFKLIQSYRKIPEYEKESTFYCPQLDLYFCFDNVRKNLNTMLKDKYCAYFVFHNDHLIFSYIDFYEKNMAPTLSEEKEWFINKINPYMTKKIMADL